MPLLDHFHPPLALTRHWESFHAAWATELMRTLNRRVLPPGFFAEAQVHVGSRVEVDVATWDEQNPSRGANGDGGVAVETWAPPATALVMPTLFPDEIEVQVLSTVTGATLVGAVEFVSPRNKDRPEARLAFAAKCASYLQMGVGLVVVDIVTGRHTNLHNELLEAMKQPKTFGFAREVHLYAVAYRPSRRTTGDQVELWLHSLAVGQALPTVPLALRGAISVPIDLEATYTAVREDSRL